MIKIDELRKIMSDEQITNFLKNQFNATYVIIKKRLMYGDMPQSLLDKIIKGEHYYTNQELETIKWAVFYDVAPPELEAYLNRMQNLKIILED